MNNDPWISVVYIDQDGRPRHTNCYGRFCRVPNCRESVMAPRIDGPPNLPEDLRAQEVIYRDAGVA